jgi:hypothetical protein
LGLAERRMNEKAMQSLALVKKPSATKSKGPKSDWDVFALWAPIN